MAGAPTPSASGSLPKAFQFIEGRPSGSRQTQDADKENRPASPCKDRPRRTATTSIIASPPIPQGSPQRPPPSTPATRLPLADLIGSPDDTRQLVVTTETSPEDHILWHPLRSPQNSQTYKTPAPKKHSRARSSSPATSSQSIIKGGRNEAEKRTVATVQADVQHRDPVLDLWKRYATNSAKEGLSLGTSSTLAFTSSSPQTRADLIVGNVGGLRRWTSCGVEWPTSGAKRRKVRHAPITEILEDTVTDVAPSAPVDVVDEDKRTRIGSLIERIHESLNKTVITEEPNGPSSSSPLPERTGTLKGQAPSPTRAMVVRSGGQQSDTLDEANDSPETEQGVALQKKASSSSFGSDGLDLTEVVLEQDDISTLKRPAKPPDPRHQAALPIPTASRLVLPLAESASHAQDLEQPSAICGNGNVVEIHDDDFDDEFDDDFGDDFDDEKVLAETGQPAFAHQERPTMSRTVELVKNTRASPARRQGQRSPLKMISDEFEDDDLDEDSFVAAEFAATQSVAASDLQSNDIIAKRAIQRYLVTNVVEGYYNAKNGQRQKEKVLAVEDETRKNVKAITLRQSWFDTRCTKGAYVHVIGDFTSTGQCLIDDTQNMLILHPDHLVSALVVADSFACIRRAVLQDRVKATSESSPPMLYGTMLHEIFQDAMQLNKWDNDSMMSIINKTISRHLEDLYDVKLSSAQAIEHLQSRLPELQAWADIFIQAKPGANATIQDRNDKQVLMSINKLLDVEEHIWSPMYGLKGNIDATVQVVMKDQDGDRVLTVPFELKTGKNQTASHRAQTALYTLMLGDRYDINIDYGILYYLESSQTTRVSAIRHELRHMIQQRNELACYIRERLSLPPMIKSAHACGRCYAKTSCFVYHKLTEGGTGETSGLKEKFDEIVQHLKPSHQDFFLKWDDLLTKEESEMMKFRRELWTMLSTEREKLGRCFANVVLEPGTAAEEDSSGKINRFRYTFRKRMEEAGHTFSESAIIVGEPIVISDEQGHYALAKGYVTSVQQQFITVAVDRRLVNARRRQPGFDMLNNQVFDGIMEVEGSQDRPSQETSKREHLPMLYRLDKDEFSNGLATVRNNLIQIMTNDAFHGREIRDLVVDGREPRFKATSTAYTLSGPQSQMQMNDDQRRAIDKILSAEDYALVLGMPGTGKTTTIAHIIRALVAKGKSVLLTSYTHTAVDNILLKIRDDNIGILRLGALAKIHHQVQEFAVLAAEPKASIEELQATYHKPQVVATTCLGINHQVFNERVFDYCIVDEASQITLPVCLGPIRMAKTFILVGDHYQLPPLVQNKEAQEGGLDVSLFRLLCEQHPSAVVALRHQYRMNTEIMLLSSTLIYEGQLVCGSDAIANRRLPVPNAAALECLHPINLSSQPTDSSPTTHSLFNCWISQAIGPDTAPVIFLNTDTLLPTSREQCRGQRITNPLEAQLTAQLVRALLLTGVPSTSIGVITLYRSQLALLKSLFTAQLPLSSVQQLEAHTADKYQGRDKDAIVLSCVRNNDRDVVGDLLKDWRRVNVAITRAKKKLIILGSRGTLSRGDALLGKLVEMCESRGWVIDLPASAQDEGEHYWGAAATTSVTRMKNVDTTTAAATLAKTRNVDTTPVGAPPAPELGNGTSTAPSLTHLTATATVPTSRTLKRTHSLPRPSLGSKSVNKPFKIPIKVATVSKRAVLGSSSANIKAKRPVLADIVNDVVGEDFWD